MDEYNFLHMRRRELRRAIKAADPSIKTDLIRFLKDDLRSFGSGYIKEIVWKFIRRYELRPEDVEQLEYAALKYLHRPMSREFKLMCQTMSRIASDGFWDLVEAELDSDKPSVQFNAYCLCAYSEGVMAGEKQRLALNSIRNELRRRFWFSTYDQAYKPDDLLEIVRKPENWPNGQVVYKTPDPSHLPIIYYHYRWEGDRFATEGTSSSRDKEVSTLDVAAGHKKKILKQLDLVLSNGTLNTWTIEAWLYAIYLLHEINDADAVLIIVKFLKDKVDYKFESVKKSMVLSTALKVLWRYQTPESLVVLEMYKHDDQHFTEHYRGSNHGWILSYP